MKRHGYRLLSAFTTAWLLALPASALVACAPSHSVVDVHTRVAVTITPSPDVLPFDPRGARLSAATEQLRETAGHYIALDVDAAMVPEFRSGFEEALGQSFENLARDMSALRKEAPEAFAYGAPLFERVSLRYDVTLTKDVTTFDTASHTLTIRGPARREALVSEGVAYRALRSAHAEFAVKQYENASPESIPPDERRSYFRFLTGSLDRDAHRRSIEADPKTAADLASSPRAARLLAVLRLSALPGSDAALVAEWRRWLLGESSWFVQQYVHAAALVRQLPANCTFKQAEASYGRWLLGNHATSTDEERLSIERAVFVRSFTQDRAEQAGRSYPPFAWPTIDRFEFGLRIVDEWRAAGHPTPVSTKRVTPAQEFIACPRTVDRGAHVVPRCDHDFYRFALETDEGRKRLAKALVERNDPVFAETAFTEICSVTDKPLDATIAMLRAVERSPLVWKAGIRVLAAESDNSTDRILLEEAQRVWLERPEYRGSILYLLARIDRYEHGNVDWRGFEEGFGSKATARDLEGYLAEGPLATALLPIAWPALDKGYSRAAVVIPKFDDLLSDPPELRTTSQGAYRGLADIVSRMCAEKNVNDLAAVRGYLTDRVSKHPGEPYIQLADEATAAKCRPAPPPPPPRNEVRLVPGKQRLRIIQKDSSRDI